MHTSFIRHYIINIQFTSLRILDYKYKPTCKKGQKTTR